MDSPFVGLVPFSEETREYFFGRERETDLVTDNASISRLSLVYGPSGAGKSSVLGAGLVPRLRGHKHGASTLGTPLEFPEDPVPVMCRDWAGDPFNAVKTAVSLALKPYGLEKLEFPKDWLRAARAPEMVKGAPPQSEVEVPLVVLILDQFEELFIQHPALSSMPSTDILKIASAFTGDKSPEVSAGLLFAGALVALLNTSNVAVNVVITLREDCLAMLDVLKGVIPDLFKTLLRIDRLDAEGLRASVEGPLARWSQAKKLGFKAGPGLVDAFLRDSKLRFGEHLATDRVAPRYEALFLQLVLQRLWSEDIVRPQLAGSGGELKAATFSALGGAAGIIGDFVGGTLRTRLNTSEKRRWFLEAARLLVSKTQKFPWKVSDLLEELSRALKDREDIRPPSGPELTKLMSELEDDWLLRRTPMTDTVKKSEEWDARFEVAHDALASEIYRWRVAQLAIVDQQEEEQREAEKRKKRLVWTAIGVLLCVVVALGWLAWKLGKTASDLTKTAGDLSAERERLSKSKELVETKNTELTKSNALVEKKNADLTASQKLLVQKNFELRRAKAAEETNQILDSVTEIDNQIENLKRKGFLDREAVQQELDSKSKQLDNALQKIEGLDPQGEFPTIAGPIKTVHDTIEGTKLRLADVREQAVEEWSKTAPVEVAKPEAGLPSEGADKSKALPHSGAVTWLAFLPHPQPGEDMAIATSSVDKTVGLWKSNGDPFTKKSASTAAVNMVAFTPDGDTIAAASNGSTIRLYDLKNARASALEKQSDSITAIDFRERRDPNQFSHGSDILASASADRTVYVYNLSAGNKVAYFSSPALPAIPTFVQFSPIKGDLVVSSADDGGVRIHSWVTKDPLRVLKGLSAPARRANFSWDDQWITACSGEGLVAYWNVEAAVKRNEVAARKTLKVTSKGQAVPVFHALFSPKKIGADFRIAAGGADGVVRLWDFLRSDKAFEAPGHEAAVRVLAWSSNAQWLASGDSKGEAIIWKVDPSAATPLKPVVRLAGHSKIIRYLTFSPDDKKLATCSDDGTARLWPSTLWEQR